MTQQNHEAIRGQTLVVIGGSSGIGLETALRARSEGADIVLTARNAERLSKVATTIGVSRIYNFDANDTFALASFFKELEGSDLRPLARNECPGSDNRTKRPHRVGARGGPSRSRKDAGWRNTSLCRRHGWSSYRPRFWHCFGRNRVPPALYGGPRT
jgi:hypothetical protein